MRQRHWIWDRDRDRDFGPGTWDIRRETHTWDTHLRPTQQPPLFCIRWFPLFISRSSDGAAKHWSNRRWMPMASVLSSRNPPTLSSLRALLLLILGCAILKYPHIHQYAHTHICTNMPIGACTLHPHVTNSLSHVVTLWQDAHTLMDPQRAALYHTDHHTHTTLTKHLPYYTYHTTLTTTR